MDNNQRLSTYIKKGAVYIYLASAIMGFVGLVLDLISLHELSEYIVINNLISIGIIIVSVLLYVFGIIKMPVSLSIIIYSILLNIVLDAVTKPYGNELVNYFMRNSLFIVYLITIGSLIANKINGIIITLVYLACFIYLTISTGDKFLKDTILLQLSVFSAYTGVIYYFVSSFEKSIRDLTEKNDIIINQNELLNETNALTEERQQKVEELAEELLTQKEDLINTNLELKDTVTTKDKFFTIIAHDLKNPLNALIGFSELLYSNSDRFSDTRKKEITKTIYESSLNASNLLNNLLVWARMQTSEIKVDPAKINLLELINEACAVLENNMINKNIELIIQVDKTQEIFADKYMLTSIVNNLVSNAIKYTPAGGIITISAEIEAENCTVCISDNGVGITPENLSKLFRLDQNISTRGTNKEKGTGLGLLLCKEFIERNQGRIWVESEPDKGSQFYFTVRSA